MHDGELGLRIGDEERAATDARLQQAVGRGQLSLAEYEQRTGDVWRAQTRADLALLTRDLPPVPAAAPPGQRPPRARRVLAVMSGDTLSGPLQPGQDVQAYAVMGGATVDLRREDLPALVRVRAVAVMGGVEVLVPHGVTVHLSGASLMGGRQVTVDPPQPGAPVVEVQGFALMGGMEVRHEDHRGAARGRPTGSEPARQDAPGSVAVTPAWGPTPARPEASPPVRRRRPRRRRGLVLGVVAGVALLVGAPAVAQADDAAVFGSREVHVHAGADVHVGVLFGSVKVVVDDGAGVDLSGGTVFGSSQCQECAAVDPSRSVIHVHARGAFGSVQVERAGTGKS